MVLLINGQPISLDSDANVCSSLLATLTPIRTQLEVKEHIQINNTISQRRLFVYQREFALVFKDDVRQLQYIATDDATTCHILVLEYEAPNASQLPSCSSQSKAFVLLAHYDGEGLEWLLDHLKTHFANVTLSGDDTVSQQLIFRSVVLRTHIVGGFLDERSCSSEVTTKLLTGLKNSEMTFNILTLQVNEWNDFLDTSQGLHFPRVMGLQVDVKTGNIASTTVPVSQREPEPVLRSLRYMDAEVRMYSVYEPVKAQLVLQPFVFHGRQSKEFYLWWAQRPDADLRKFSTSPAQEPEHFAEQVRQGFLFLCQHPAPKKTVFRKGKPLCYVLQENGLWLKVASGKRQ